MGQIIGIVLFALGIVISVSLHEAGHMAAAKAFGMKVTRYFIGFGSTLWSFRRGDTEYGLKAIPAGGFVKIVGMTPQDDDVEPGDEPRAMWRFPVWKRTVVMAAGSVTHFLLGLVILWAVFAFVALPDYTRAAQATPVVDQVAPCVTPTWQVDPATGLPRQCTTATDPVSPAAEAGLRPGDMITQINNTRVTTWEQMTGLIRGAGGSTVTIHYLRDGTAHSATVTLPLVERVKESVPPNTPVTEITKADLAKVGVLGITEVIPRTTAGPVAAFGRTADQTGAIFQNTFTAIKKFPEKVPKLWAAITGQPRDPQTPISVVGASRIGGELFQHGELPSFMLLLASLNFFVGVFNLLPLLPLDGGHIAIAWFERTRSWLYSLIGRRDPGRVDYYKLMPMTYAFILLFGGFFVLTVAADIINPIKIPF